MNISLGTIVVVAIIVAIVAAVLHDSWKKHQRGEHVACDNCGACSGGNPETCAAAEKMLRDMEERAAR
jgi:hypothetical protein